MTSVNITQTNSIDLPMLTNQINYYFAITIVPIGIITNAISVCVFLRKSLSVTNMGLFNLLISAANFITLVYYLFVSESNLVFRYDLLTLSDPGCRILMMFRRVIRELAPVVELVMTFERFMSVYYPKRFIIVQKRSFLLALIGAIFAFCCILSFENFFYYLDVKNGTRSCTGVELVTVSSDLMSATLRTFIPFFIMFSMNILMVRRLITRKMIRSSSKSRREYQFTISVVSMNALFLILNFPVSILYIVRIFFMGSKSHAAQVVNFAWNIAYLIATFHYVLTNLTNLIFNRLFREELVKILLGDRLDSQTNQSSVSRLTPIDNLERAK